MCRARTPWASWLSWGCRGEVAGPGDVSWMLPCAATLARVCFAASLAMQQLRTCVHAAAHGKLVLLRRQYACAAIVIVCPQVSMCDAACKQNMAS